MTPKFQNRLVGAIILVALGVIILPDVFDGEKKHYQEEIQPIPLQLQDDVDERIINVPIEKPVFVDDVVLPKVVVNNITTDQPTEKNKPKKKAEVDEIHSEISKETIEPPKPDAVEPEILFKETAWVIRLGTFRNHENANALAEKLKTQGFPAQVRPRNLQKGDLARVEIGPELSEKKIASMRTELESITGLKGQIIKFDPITL